MLAVEDKYGQFHHIYSLIKAYFSPDHLDMQLLPEVQLAAGM
jgi:hypothetical protein